MPDQTTADQQQKPPVYVYEWNAWKGFLFHTLCTYAERIEGKMRQSNSAILKQIPAGKGYFLCHVNLTKPNIFYRNKKQLMRLLLNQGITPLNAEITDTSKRHVQDICRQTGINVTSAPVEGDADELLIVKTNLNFGGRAEKRLPRLASLFLRPGSRNYSTEIIYPVMARKLVTKDTWQNKNMVVEKYIANDDNYIYRVYKVLNQVVVAEVIEDGLIKKLIHTRQRTNYFYQLSNNEILPGGDPKFVDLVKDIITLSKAMQLDFAAIDVVRSNDNKYYIIDVNITPNWNGTDQSKKMAFLAAGLV